MTCVQDCIQASILSRRLIPVRFILTHVTEGFVEVECMRCRISVPLVSCLK